MKLFIIAYIILNLVALLTPSKNKTQKMLAIPLILVIVLSIYTYFKL